MDRLLEILSKLTEPQMDALAHVATAMLYSQPKSEDEWLTVKQIHEQYGRPESSVYSAMSRGILPFVTPNGQTRPRYSKRADVERWMGVRMPAT